MGTASAAPKQPETGEGHKKKALSLPALKGAPLSVLIALWRYGPQDRKALAEGTGWSTDAVGEALHLLVERGLATRRHYRCWEVAQGLDVVQALGEPDGGARREEPVERSSGRVGVHEKGRRGHEKGRTRSSAASAGTRTGNQGGDAGHETELSTPSVDSESRFQPPSPAAERRRHPTSRWERRLRRPSAAESRSQVFSDAGKAHDVVVGVDYHDQREDHGRNNIIQQLHALHPPFHGAAAWLETVPLERVAGWLAYLRAMDGAAREGIRNEAAFVRKQVTAGRRPPPLPERQKPHCPICGRAHFNERGECLVCSGHVRV